MRVVFSLGRYCTAPTAVIACQWTRLEKKRLFLANYFSEKMELSCTML